MAKRSLKASSPGILKAKRAFDIRGWTQEYLAAEVGLQTRQSVWKFFSGRPVERHIFIDICFSLDLDWEEIVDRQAFLSDSDGLDDNSSDVGPTPTQPQGDLTAARSHLVALALNQCQLLELPFDLQQPLTLTQLYTAVYLRPYHGQPMVTPHLPATTALQAHPRALILGGAGAGKTTLLQHLALELGNDRLRVGDTPYLPVFLRLRQLALVPVGSLGLQPLLNQRWLASGLSLAQVDQLWQQGPLWLLLDGWDELPAEHQLILTQQIQTLLDTYPSLRVLISGRRGGPVPHLSGLVALELSPFAPQQVETFVHKWFTANGADQGETQAQACLEALHQPDNDRLREMALTPILLYLICLVFQRSGQFPSQRSRLYQQALDLLLGQWDQQRGISRHQPLHDLSPADLLGLLSEVAAQSFEQGQVVLDEAELTGLIAQGLARRGMRAANPDQAWANSRAILQTLIEHYGMLTERDLGTYAFAHLSFQEYLTARRWALTALDRPAPHHWADLAQHLPSARWREVIVLTVEMVPQAQPLWEALWQHSQGYVARHSELQARLVWAQRQAERVEGPFVPAALRGFYLGLGLDHGLDLALALDARLGLDLPWPLALDLALARLLHQAQHWLAEPTLGAGFDLAFALDLQPRFNLSPTFGAGLGQLQAQLSLALADETTLAAWADRQGADWLQALESAVATERQWGESLGALQASPALAAYYDMVVVVVACLRHHRSLATVATNETCLLLPEMQYDAV